eukprot:scaffold8921_cov137-Isochrysis_galbana.AAC.3
MSHPRSARTVTPSARSGTTSQFAPKAVPDMAPSPNHNFNFKAPATVVRSTADPHGDLSSSFAHPLPPGSREAQNDKDGCLLSWVELVEGQPDQVASLYRVSRYYDTILQVLNSNASIGTLWHHRVFHTEATMSSEGDVRMELPQARHTL